MFNKRIASLALSAVALFACKAQAQTVLFSDNFDVDSSANWSVFNGSGNGTNDSSVFFAFNYLTNKFVRNGITNTIPAAPNGGGKGVKMFVNKNDAVPDIAAVSLYPIGKSFSYDFAFKFDMWLNYNGGFQGGSGSTEFATFGIDHLGNRVNWQDGLSASDGNWFAVTGEGGAANDYRSLDGDGSNPALNNLGQPGGFLDRDQDFYFESEVFNEPFNYPFKAMFPPPSFETPGVPGKQWVQMEIRQRTNDLSQHVISWLMNNYVIAEHTNADLVGMTSGNIMLGNMDIFSSIANPAADNYVIYDNVRVVDLSGVTPLPVVTVVTNIDTALESPPGSNASFTITRYGSTATNLVVSYRMSGSASNGVDYVTLPGSVTILAGQTSTNITVTPINDTIGEGTETVMMTMVGSTNYDLYTNVNAVAFILDDGDLPVATISAFRRAAYEGNTNLFGQLRVEFSNAYISDNTVNYTISGTAANGVQYQTIPNSIVVTNGQTNAFINIIPKDDASTVSNTTVTITLTAGANYILAASNLTATVTIFNDDLPAATATLFSDNFDVDSSANWNINPSNLNDDSLFAYDYSLIGIPVAPHSATASTLGLRLRANSPNLGAAVFSAISVSPKNQSFTNDYRVRFDWWINFPGAFPGGGAGSTQLGVYGITRGTIPQWPGSASTADSVYFALTGDAGSSIDVRVYTNAGGTVAASKGVYAAGTGSSVITEEDPYYAVFGRLAAPAAQLAAYPSQTGLTAVGSLGEAWHDVVITKLGNSITWTVDGLRLSTLNAEDFGITLSTNIFLGQSDINSGQTTVGLDDMQCSIYDNVRVESLALPTVNITSTAIVTTNAVLTFTGGVSDPAVAYKVADAAAVVGPYTVNTNAVITLLAPGSFKAVVPTNGVARFYRIRR